VSSPLLATDQPSFPPASEPRYSRRLTDKILIAFHHACDQQNLPVAGELLEVMALMGTRRSNLPNGLDRRERETLVAAHERLWQLRHPEAAAS
jgi:hypothetical protein